MSEIPSESVKVSASVEAQHLVKRMASPAPAGEHVKTAIRRVARALGWSFNRVKDCWYADPRISLDSIEMDWLRKKAAEEAVDDATEARAQLLERLARVEAILAIHQADKARRVDRYPG